MPPRLQESDHPKSLENAPEKSQLKILLHGYGLGLNNNAITVNGMAQIFAGNGEAFTSSSSITINSTGALDIGASGTVTVNGAVSGTGTLLLNHGNTNSGSTVILASTANTFTGNVVSSNYNGGARPLYVNSFGDGGKFTVGYNSGNGSQTSKIFGLHSGAIAPLTFNVRQFEMIGPNTAFIDNLTLSNNSAQAFTINTDLLVNALGTRTLTLNGTNAAGLSTFGGVIPNGSLTSLAVTKAEAGKWVLSGANTYTGATTISAGTLEIQGSIASSASISNSASLIFNSGSAQAYGNVISGAGTLTKNGVGDLTLSGANTFTGTSTVSGGKILMTNALALQYSAYNTNGSNGTTIGLDVTNGLSSGTLTLGGLSGSVNLASSITAGYTTGLTNLTLNPQTGVTFTYTGAIADATTGMTVIKTGAGTQILGNNTFTGSVVVNAGTLQLAGTNAFTDITVNGATLTSGGTDVGRFTLGADGGTITFTGTSSYNPQRSSSQAVLLYNKNVNVSSGTTTFGMSTQYYKEAFSGVLSGSGTIVKNDGNATLAFSNAANTFTGAIRLDAGVAGLEVNSLADSANAITFNANTGAFSLGAGTASSLLFNSRQIVLAHANGGEIGNNNGSASNTVTINTNLGFSGAGTRLLELSGSNVGDNAFNGIIGNNGGSAVGVTKAGAGVWILSGANTYTGVTTVTTGTLAFSGNANVASANPLGQSTAAASNLLLANGTTLRYVGAAASIDRGFTLNVSSNNQGASLDASGTGAINFTNTASPAYGTAAQPRTLTLTGTNTGNNTLAANLADNTTGAVSIAKTGIGTWVLTGANVNTGNNTISGGGKLILDYGVAASPQDSSKIAGVLTFNNGGGDLTLRGGSHVEAVTSTSMTTGGGHAHISREVGSTATLSLGAISRSQSAGFTASFAADNLATTTTANARGMLGGAITVGSNWAKNDGSGNIIALTSGDYTALPTGAVTSTVNYELSGSQTHTGSASMNSLRIVGTGLTDQTLDLGANQLQLGTVTLNTLNNSGGLLYAGGGTNNYTITGTNSIQGQNGREADFFPLKR